MHTGNTRERTGTIGRWRRGFKAVLGCSVFDISVFDCFSNHIGVTHSSIAGFGSATVLSPERLSSTSNAKHTIDSCPNRWPARYLVMHVQCKHSFACLAVLVVCDYAWERQRGACIRCVIRAWLGAVIGGRRRMKT